MQEPYSTRHLVCPVCDGGASKEKSFALTVEPDSIKFICHRASCGVRGVIENSGVRDKVIKPKSKIRKYDGVLESLPPDVYDFLTATYCLEDTHLEQLGAAWAPERAMVKYDVTDYRGKHKGIILRSYGDNRRKQVLTYKATEDDTFLAWMNCSSGRPNDLVIVEDIVSAARASDYMQSVALLGTHMSKEDVLEIAQFVKSAGIENVLLALDADAYNKALELKNRYQLFFPMQVVKLDKDIKNMEPEEIWQTLYKV